MADPNAAPVPLPAAQQQQQQQQQEPEVPEQLEQGRAPRIDSKHGMPTQSFPDIGISAKMFVARMNDYFELQVAMGNDLMSRDNVKQLTFLNNVTGTPGNALQLYRDRKRNMNEPITYADLIDEFKRNNTNLAEQENIMTTLTYRLQPDTNIYRHEEAVTKHVQRFNELVSQLEGARDDDRLRDAFLHSIHEALSSQVKAMLISRQQPLDQATLSDVQQLAVANANAYQDKWLQLRSRQAGMKRSYQQYATTSSRVSNISSANDNETDEPSNSTSNINVVANQTKRRSRGVLVDMIRQY
jgi:hypothetical protein